jgi:hypothetical protein
MPAKAGISGRVYSAIRAAQHCTAAAPTLPEVPAFSLWLKFILSAAAGGVEGLGRRALHGPAGRRYSALS